jgi:undecaprenyl-diphosphatase
MLDLITMWGSQLNIPFLTPVAQLIDNDLIFLVLVLVIAFIAEQGKKRNRLVLILVLVYILSTGVKYLVHEARPCLIIPSKIECPGSYSFPSSNAAVAFALAAGLWKKPNGWAYTVFAIFVAFTRVYLGVHTFFDVFGGMLLGVAGYLVLYIVWEKAPAGLKTPFSGFLG